jgi:hypothetical protein
MCRKLLMVAALAAAALLPGRLIAGGPPWLCLPIDGVTAGNAAACTELINAKLGTKLWKHDGPYAGGATIRRDKDQQYMTFYMQEDIRLSEIEAALKGTEFSIPRDRLRLFGHVILEIDAGQTPPAALLESLGKLDQVSVAESQAEKNLLLVTAEMPYPVVRDRPKPDFIGWVKFVRNDYLSQGPSKTDSPTTRDSLPSYDGFRDLVAKHDASLKDIRWSMAHACRALGCVSAPKSAAEIAATLQRSSLKAN